MEVCGYFSVFIILLISSQTTHGQQTGQRNLIDNSYILTWSVNQSSETITFNARVRTGGWVGLGLNREVSGPGMAEAELLVAGIDLGDPGNPSSENPGSTTTTAAPPTSTASSGPIIEPIPVTTTLRPIVQPSSELVPVTNGPTTTTEEIPTTTADPDAETPPTGPIVVVPTMSPVIPFVVDSKLPRQDPPGVYQMRFIGPSNTNTRPSTPYLGASWDLRAVTESMDTSGDTWTEVTWTRGFGSSGDENTLDLTTQGEVRILAAYWTADRANETYFTYHGTNREVFTVDFGIGEDGSTSSTSTSTSTTPSTSTSTTLRTINAGTSTLGMVSMVTCFIGLFSALSIK